MDGPPYNETDGRVIVQLIVNRSLEPITAYGFYMLSALFDDRLMMGHPSKNRSTEALVADLKL